MNKVVLITGASGGLGKEITKIYLQKRGYNLILVDKNASGFEEFKENKNVDCVVGDITKKETLDILEKLVKDKYKKLDILINNAGITYIQPFEKNTEEQLDNLLAIDLKAPIFLTQRFYGLMVKQKSGHIINVNSSAGIEPKLNHTMYNAAKFGLTGFTKSLRLEAKKHNIRVTSVHPGGIKTPFYDKLDTKVDMSSYMDPKEVAEIVVFLSETEDLSPDEIIINRMAK